MDLYQCEKCGHAQLLDVVNPDNILGYTADSFFDDPNSSPNITYPSTWVSDENVGYAIDCDTYQPCQISVSSIDGQLNQTVTVNNSISTPIVGLEHPLNLICLTFLDISNQTFFL